MKPEPKLAHHSEKQYFEGASANWQEVTPSDAIRPLFRKRRILMYQVIEGVVAQLAPLNLVVNLEFLQRAAFPTSPPISLQHPLHQPPVKLLPQLDPLYLLQPLPTVSNPMLYWPV